jgi:AraC-like DNA-binding protein
MPPPVGAERLLACVWVQEPDDDHVQRIVPDGCVDLIWLTAHRLVFAGADTGPRTVRLPSARRSTGVRLLPEAAGAVLGVPASEVRDQQVDAASLWGDRAIELDERLRDARPDDRVGLLAASVLQRRPDPDPLVAAAASRVGCRGARVALVARELGVSERALQRHTMAAVGYGPKMLGRVIRLQRLVRFNQHESLASRAWAAGYASQGHMNEEVRRLTGLTPVAFLKDAGHAPP